MSLEKSVSLMHRWCLDATHASFLMVTRYCPTVAFSGAWISFKRALHQGKVFRAKSICWERPTYIAFSVLAESCFVASIVVRREALPNQPSIKKGHALPLT